jgi:hypothetical protein
MLTLREKLNVVVILFAVVLGVLVGGGGVFRELNIITRKYPERNKNNHF